jgi:4-hydroxymandelate oxidase
MADRPPPFSVQDWRRAAEAALSPDVLAYFEDVAEDGVTALRERNVWSSVPLRPRVLVDTSEAETTTEILGHSLGTPLLPAPVALQGLVHPEGELATVRGATAAGSLAIVSSASSMSMDEIGRLGCPWWLQLYPLADRSLTAEVIGRARAAGASALVLTVDVPVLGRRAAGLVSSPQAVPALLREMIQPGETLADVYVRTGGRPVTWSELEWFQSRAELPILLKGVLDPTDARDAAAAGVAGLVVSTHGGRQLDGCPSALEALPPVVDAVAGRCAVLADGGVRRGSHALRLLARGAAGVLVGRPVIWGLAADGEAGVRSVIDILTAELRTAMALCGQTRISDLDRSVEWRPNEPAS